MIWMQFPLQRFTRQTPIMLQMQECVDEKKDDNDNCKDCLNWNILNGKYLKIVTDEHL